MDKALQLKITTKMTATVCENVTSCLRAARLILKTFFKFVSTFLRLFDVVVAKSQNLFY